MLEIPNWVPPAVAAMAREMHGSLNVLLPGLKDHADVIERLACDDRMRRVWRELQKKHRPVDRRGKLFSPGLPCSRAQPSVASKRQNVPAVRKATRNLTQEGKLQNEACAILFNEVAKLRSWPAGGTGPRTITTKEATREIAALRAVARHIRADAETLRQLRFGYLSPSLEDVAAQCLALAALRQAYNDHDVLIVSRNRSRVGSPWERGFVITVAHILEHFFGQKMQSLVAVLANVAFDRNDITESQVNGVFRRKGVS